MTLDEWLATPLTWRLSSESERAIDRFDYRATGPNGEQLGITIGDFPAEDLYALTVNGAAVGSFNNFPTTWVKQGMLQGGAAPQTPGSGKCPYCGK